MIQNQQHFVYIDSSQDQDYHYRNQLHQNYRHHSQQHLNHSDIQYQDSSSSNSTHLNKCTHKLNQNHPNAKHKSHKSPHRLCKINSDHFLLNDNYIQTVQRIIQQNQQQLAKKAPLLITDTDKQILENLQKRKKNYGFFLRTLITDKHYQQILKKKVQKVKNENQRKKQVLINKKLNQNAKQDENQMKKYVLDKKLKQDIVIDKVQKHAYKLGIQRIRNQEKQTKNELKQIDEANLIKTINLDIKQRNQIYELREQLEEMRQINRVNKLDQKKALKDLEKDVVHTKQALVSKAETAQMNKFII